MPSRTLPLQHYLLRIVAVCLVPVAVIASALAVDDFQRALDRRSRLVKAVAQNTATAVHAELQRRIRGLEALKTAADAQPGQDPLRARHAHASAFDAAFAEPVFLIDEQRRMLLHSRRPLGAPLTPLPTPPGRSAITAAWETHQPQVGDVLQGPILNRPVLPLVVPLNEGGKRYAWIINVRTTEFDPPLRAADVPQGWVITLRDGAGQTIAMVGDGHAQPVGPDSAPGRQSARRVTQAVASSNWTVTVEVDRWPFYWSALPLQRGAVLLLILAGALAYVRMSSRRLNEAVDRLIYRPQTQRAPRPGGALLITEIEQARRDMQRLDAAQHSAQEDERRRLARDLHDGLQQNLAALQMDLELAMQSLGQGQAAAAGSQIRKARDATQALVHEIHGMVGDLRPRVLDELGLKAALQHLVDHFASTTQLDAELELRGDEATLDTLPVPLSSCLYRVAQECLNNVRKHAQASFVLVELDTRDAGLLRLRVSDNGVGFVQGDPVRPGSHGMLGMAERVGALGGNLRIERGDAPDFESGTTVVAELPLRAWTARA